MTGSLSLEWALSEVESFLYPVKSTEAAADNMLEGTEDFSLATLWPDDGGSMTT